jgi:hypothetical protein
MKIRLICISKISMEMTVYENLLTVSAKKYEPPSFFRIIESSDSEKNQLHITQENQLIIL